MTTSRSERRQTGNARLRSGMAACFRALPFVLLAAVSIAEETLSPTDPITVPSDQAVTLLDIVPDAPGPDGPVARYRFLAPQIAREGGSVGFAQAADDLQHLCDRHVVPDLGQKGALPDLVILSMSDRPVEFGATDPDATQFFAAFRIVGGRCILEPF